MKISILSLVITFFTAICAFSANSADAPVSVKHPNTGIAFTENKGQVYDQNYKVRPDVLFGAMVGNMAFHLKTNGVSYQLYRTDAYKDVVDERTKEKRKEIEKQTIYRIDLNWLNYNKNFTVITHETLRGYTNFYLESCPEGALNVRSYKGVTLHNLYKNIDLHYYEKNGELKHDYIVAAHADYKQIQIQVEGAAIVVNKDGSLLLTTPLGKIQEGAPIVFQNGRQLVARWKIDNSTLSFDVENYNPEYELIIDPVTRLWGTYYGGTIEDYSFNSTSDSFGNLYLTGYTSSNTGTAIATTGSHQASFGASVDAFLAKFNSNGVRQWGTYYGGTGFQIGYSCATDAAGNVYMSGGTTSGTGTTIPTVGSHQTAYGGGTDDAFLVKFNANGIRQWGTYYGGSSTEYGNSCATDANGNVYMTGYSNSSNVNSIATPGSHQPSLSGGYDAFIVKFNSSGSRQWGTYYGGSGSPIGDFAYSCITDANGNVYVGGMTGTNTGTNIATSTGHQSTYGGGTSDGFLAKFNSNGVRQWATYYGGSGEEIVYSCAIESTGNIYFAGFSASATGSAIATAASHQSVNAGGAYDAYLAKFDSNGNRQWGTFYGGTGDDQGYSCHVDANNNVYLAGFTNSNTGTLIATAASHQSVYGGGTYDGFLVKFNNSGARQWGTYYGGAAQDRGYSCISDNAGSMYLAGYSDSNTGTSIATAGSHQSTYGGGTFDAFLAKFDICDLPPVQPSAISGSTTFCSGAGPFTYSIITVSGATSYSWSLPFGWSGTNNTNIITPTLGSSGAIIVSAANSCGNSPQQTLSVTINPLPNITASSSNPVLCEGESATITAFGAISYSFNPGGLGNSITVTPNSTSSYTITGTDAKSCSNTAVFTQSVDVCTSIKNEELKITNTHIRIYPNPFEDLLTLELDAVTEIVIVNSIGQIIYSGTINSGAQQINLSNFASGLYLVKVGCLEKSASIKIVKQ